MQMGGITIVSPTLENMFNQSCKDTFHTVRFKLSMVMFLIDGAREQDIIVEDFSVLQKNC
jgi:hypothetical protein